MNIKNILLINNRVEFGGIETLIYRKSKWLIKNGYNVFLITNGGAMEESIIQCGVSIIKSDIITLSYRLSEIFNLYNKIVKEMDTKCINVIECFNPNEAFVGLILSKLFQCKLLVGEYHPNAFIEGCFENECLKNTIQLYDRYNSLIYMNEDTLNNHKDYYKISLKNNILGLAVDIKGEKAYFNRKEEFKVLSIGRLVDFKRYVYGLISDFDKFYNEQSNSKLIIIGDGTGKRKLIIYASKFKSYKDGKIVFLGTVPYDELNKYIYDASMVVGMGTSLLEMASAGIPAIIAPAFVENNISNGFNFEDDNIGDTKNSCIKTYFDYMQYIYNCNDDEYQELCKQSRKAVVDNYSIDSIMQQWLEMVNECEPILMDIPLDDFIIESPFGLFLSAEKRNLKCKLKNVLNKCLIEIHKYKISF